MPTYITTQVRTYNNRRLKAGDEMPGISRRDGELMVKLGRAERIPDALAPSNFTPPPPPKPKAVEPVAAPANQVGNETPPPPAPDVHQADRGDALAVAREDYESIVGKRWFHAWDEAELRKRIAEHQAGADAS